MKRKKVIISLLLFALASLSLLTLISCSTIHGLYCRMQIKSGLREPGQYGPARLEIYNDIPVVHLYGTRDEMGTQYGALLKKPLQALHGYVNAFIPKDYSDKLIARAKEVEKNLPPEMISEMKAIAAAAEIPYDELLALNVTPKLACSTLAVWETCSEGGKLIMGRNADYYGMGLSDRGSLVVVYHPKEGKKVLSVNFIGMVGSFTGINEDGVAYGNMLVFNNCGPDLDPEGLPIHLQLRRAAQGSSSSKEMCAKLLLEKHIIPMNVMVADSKEAFVLELGGFGNVVRKQAPEKDYIAASNHFRSEQQKAKERHCDRYDALVNAAEKREGKFGVEQMEKALAASIVEDWNLQAAVFVPADMKLLLSINKIPAAEGPYQEFDLKKIFSTPESGPAETAK